MPEVSTTQAQIEDFYLNKSRTVMKSMDIQKGEGGGGDFDRGSQSYLL